MNPHIYAITGRPRSPSDQGSIESMNKMVQRILGTLLTERRLAGDNGPYLVDLGFAISNLEITYAESALEKKAYSITAAPCIDPLQGSVLLGNCWCIGTRLQEHRVGKKHSETTYHFAGGLLVWGVCTLLWFNRRFWIFQDREHIAHVIVEAAKYHPSYIHTTGTDDGWQTMDDRWRMTDDRWQTTDDRQRHISLSLYYSMKWIYPQSRTKTSSKTHIAKQSKNYPNHCLLVHNLHTRDKNKREK